jgi:hypothetical protein
MKENIRNKEGRIREETKKEVRKERAKRLKERQK